MYYRRDGTPFIDSPDDPACLQWAREFEGNKRVCSTKFWWGGWLSTVWLGIDHNFGFGRPVIFESMLFGWPYLGEVFDRERMVKPDLGCWRYSTERDAIAGHSRLVRKYKWPWREIWSWAWQWFEDWERSYTHRHNLWSMSGSFIDPPRRQSFDEMLAKLKETTKGGPGE